jgi:alpha-L-rhamnosidase
MYERIAGIKALKPGYREILIAPITGGPLTSAEATYNSPYGKISSSWKIENETFKLETTIPPNTTAKVVIPANTDENLLLNSNPFSDNLNVKLLQKTESAYELVVQPGTYLFE